MTDEPQRLRAERDAALRRVQELSAAHEEFLHAIAHDLRAPLRHVTSYAALLREVLADLDPPPESVREALGYAATLEHSARRMALMIDGLQALSRAARAPLVPARVDLPAALAQARAALPGVAGAGAVHWEVAPHMPALQADPALLAQLLAQLLGNAVKFSQGVALPRVSVGAQAAHGRVLITIADNGAGFDERHAQGLFGVFQRLHRDGEFAGVGAGLALCKLIADRHGARIAAHAQPGAGCTVTLDWPAG